MSTTEGFPNFLDHITRSAADLPLAQFRQRRLMVRQNTRNASGGGYSFEWKEYPTDFIVDMPMLRSGWQSFVEGTGRVVHATLVTSGKQVTKPADPKASAVALVPVTAGTTMAELEIADTTMSVAFGKLYKAYRCAPEVRDDLIPVVHFIPGINPEFNIIGWVERDENFWGIV